MPTIDRRGFLGSALGAFAAGDALGQAEVAGVRGAAGGVLRRVVSTEITSMDPQRPTGQVTSDLAAELFTGLTYYDRNGRVAPGCAASWG